MEGQEREKVVAAITRWEGKGKFLLGCRTLTSRHMDFSPGRELGSVLGSPSGAEQPIHRGRLRPLENIDIYIMIHNSGMITVMK